MAMKKVVLGVALMQMIIAFVALIFCSKHYFDSYINDSEMPSMGAVFALRLTPLVSLIICATIGLITAFLEHPTANAVYMTANMYSTYLLTTLVWYLFSYWNSSQYKIDQTILPYCLAFTVLSLTMCLGYIAYEIILRIVTRHSAKSLPESDTGGADNLAYTIEP